MRILVGRGLRAALLLNLAWGGLWAVPIVAATAEPSQTTPEQGYIDSGNKHYAAGRFEKALKAFQVDAGIGITGRADEATWKALEAGAGESGAS